MYLAEDSHSHLHNERVTSEEFKTGALLAPGSKQMSPPFFIRFRMGMKKKWPRGWYNYQVVCASSILTPPHNQNQSSPNLK